MTLTYVLALLVAATLGFLSWRGARIWTDSGRIAGTPDSVARRLGWSLWGAIVPSHYWWGARLEAMSPEEQQRLLAREIEALGLNRADAEVCPLCGVEIPEAWTLDSEGRLSATFASISAGTANTFCPAGQKTKNGCYKKPGVCTWKTGSIASWS